MKNWPKVMEFVISHGILPLNFTIFCMIFVTAKKLNSNLESPHFPMFFRQIIKCRKCKMGKRDGHGKSRNGHGKVMGKYVVKYVGTLSRM